MAYLTANRHLINWPQGQTIDDQSLIKYCGVQIHNDSNATLNDITFDPGDLNPQVKGTYHSFFVLNKNTRLAIEIDVVDPKNADLPGYETAAQPSAADRTQQPAYATAKPAKKLHMHSKKKLIAAVLIILAIIIALLTSCHHRNQQQANNREQASSIQQNSKKAKQNSAEISQLKDQVAQLKAAAKQYQKDQNRQALNQKLDDLMAQNNQLKQSAQDSATQHDCDHINEAIEQIRQHPNDASQIANSLDSISNAINRIRSQF